MEERIKVGISACLLGRKVRYDGGHSLDYFLTKTLDRYIEWIPVCPETEAGLPVPREAMRLFGDVNSPRLKTIETNIDHTERLLSWTKKKLDELELKNLCGFVFKSRSPSSGMKGVKVYDDTGHSRPVGTGIFARAFMDRFPNLPVTDEEDLHDPVLRENFIEQILDYRLTNLNHVYGLEFARAFLRAAL